MKTLKITIQFKKDLKRYKNRPKVIEKLEFILGLLQNELPIPEENKPHPLTGNYRGHMECHVENDTLLVTNSLLFQIFNLYLIDTAIFGV